jgi:hypothetical protein
MMLWTNNKTCPDYPYCPYCRNTGLEFGCSCDWCQQHGNGLSFISTAAPLEYTYRIATPEEIVVWEHAPKQLQIEIDPWKDSLERGKKYFQSWPIIATPLGWI